MSLVDTFKKLHFYDYLIDRYDHDIALPYIKLKEEARDTYMSFYSINSIKEYFDKCDHVICVMAQTNANIMHLFFYIDNKYYFRSTHKDDTIISILKTYGSRLTKLSEHQENARMNTKSKPTPAEQLSIAIMLASVAFSDMLSTSDHPKPMLDKTGRPYILHCLAVMDGVKHYNDDGLSSAAVMHDIIEDTDITYQNLRDAGFSDRVIDLVSILTREKGQDYDNYIDVISDYPDAIKIKLADLAHNMQIQRMECLIDKDCERISKYHAAYHKLYKILHTT